MEIKTVSVIGLGALGILFARHLTEKIGKENVRIVADEARIKRYREEGVYCNGERCDFHYVTPEEIVEPADLILFTVKYQGLNDAIKAVKNHVGENTVLISALNGIISEEIIGEAYGFDKVIYCVAQGMDAVKTGNQLTYDHMGMLVIGDREPGIVSEKVKRLARFFESTEFPHAVDTDMKKRMFGKFMLNVGVNQTVAVHQCHYRDVQKEGTLRETMIAAMREVMAISEKEGVNLTEEDLTYWIQLLDGLGPNGKPSMAQDVEARRLSEVDLFAGTVLEFGKKHDIATPVNQMLYDRIKEIESHYVED